MAKFKFTGLLISYAILSGLILFSVSAIKFTQNETYKILFSILLIFSFVAVGYTIYKTYKIIIDEVVVHPAKKYKIHQEKIKKVNPGTELISTTQRFLLYALVPIVILYLFRNTHNVVTTIFYVSMVIYALFILILIFKPAYCPNCGAKLPIIRKPINKQEEIYGWTHCPKCNAQIDSSGNLVTGK